MTDRELDAFVATRVMGWTYWLRSPGSDEVFCRHPDDKVAIEVPPRPMSLADTGPEWDFYTPPNRFRTVTMKDHFQPAPDGHPGIATATYPVSFSTDIAAAWTVVEEMRKRTGLRVHIEGPPAGSWYCAFGDTRDGTSVSDVQSATLPRAVCLAALRALHVEGV